MQFSIGGDLYALELSQVREVISVPETTPVPNTPPSFVGMMDIRGSIVALHDPRSELNLPNKEVDGDEVVIIVNVAGLDIGIKVDTILQVLTIADEAIHQIPEINAQVPSHFISGAYKTDEKWTILVHLEAFINQSFLKYVQQKAA